MSHICVPDHAGRWLPLRTDDEPRTSSKWPSDAPFERLRQRAHARSAASIDICAASSIVPAGTQALPSCEGQPTGHISVANASTISGWAVDPDSPTSVLTVRTLIDGVLWNQQHADKAGDTSQNPGHGFRWSVNQILGSAATNHTVQVTVNGVDSAGHPDGKDVILTGDRPVEFKGSCAAIPEDCGPPGGTPVQVQCPLGGESSDILLRGGGGGGEERGGSEGGGGRRKEETSSAASVLVYSAISSTFCKPEKMYVHRSLVL